MNSRLRKPHVTRAATEIAVAAIGGAFVVCAAAANQQWLDQHFLPSFLLPRHWFVRIETGVRLVLGAIGVLLALFARPRVGRVVSQAPARALAIAGAALLALAASEPALRRVHLGPAEWLAPDEEPRRRLDPRL